ncbi:hypothetical protein [Embleya sp. NBC_00896]|uniref:hypothetical protein n=1 Tax=Embleya sp. NBC_00896 TaxID=2975961 RepID=UPI002F91AABE|nr:hypothetical protein OG928_46970 [Embleya sp. NBC_00896]
MSITYSSIADDHPMFSAEAYAAVEAAAEGLPALYVPSVLEHAAELLTSLWAIGDRHSVPPAQWSWTGNMAEGVLDLAACPYERDLETERTDAEVTSLTGFLFGALVSEEIGLRAQLGARRDHVVVNRGPATPRGGRSGDSDVLVAISYDRGWYFAFSDTHFRRMPVMAPSSPAGAHQVAEAIRAFVHGKLGDTFHR